MAIEQNLTWQADYKAELVQSGTISLDAERAIMGREAYETLSCIGLDDLAANGESMVSNFLSVSARVLTWHSGAKSSGYSSVCSNVMASPKIGSTPCKIGGHWYVSS